jgi:hypothetical protein
MSDVQEHASRPVSMPRRLGQICMGFAVGILLVLALIELYSLAGHLTPFRYQGF